MDFIVERPLAEYPGGVPGLLQGPGVLIRKLQAAPPFPAFGIYPDAIQGALAGLSGSELLAPGELERHAAGLARIKDGLPWDPAGLVSSHCMAVSCSAACRASSSPGCTKVLLP